MSHSASPLNPKQKPPEIIVQQEDVKAFFKDRAAGKLGGRLVVKTNKSGAKVISYKPSFWFFHKLTSEYRLTEIAKLVTQLRGSDVDPRFVGLFEHYNQTIPKKQQVSAQTIANLKGQAYETLLQEAKGGENGTSPISGARLRELLQALSPDNQEEFLNTAHLTAIASQYLNPQTLIDPEVVIVLKEYNSRLKQKIPERTLAALDEKLLKEVIATLNSPKIFERMHSKLESEKAKYQEEFALYSKALSLQSLKNLFSHVTRGSTAPSFLKHDLFIAIAKQEPAILDNPQYSGIKKVTLQFYSNRLKELSNDKSLTQKQKINGLVACMAKLTILLQTDSRYMLEEAMKDNHLSNYVKYFPNISTLIPDQENLQDILTILHNTRHDLYSIKTEPLYNKLAELLRPDYLHALKSGNGSAMQSTIRDLPVSLIKKITADFIPELTRAAGPPVDENRFNVLMENRPSSIWRSETDLLIQFMPQLGSRAFFSVLKKICTENKNFKNLLTELPNFSKNRERWRIFYPIFGTAYPIMERMVSAFSEILQSKLKSKAKESLTPEEIEELDQLIDSMPEVLAHLLLHRYANDEYWFACNGVVFPYATGSRHLSAVAKLLPETIGKVLFSEDTIKNKKLQWKAEIQ